MASQSELCADMDKEREWNTYTIEKSVHCKRTERAMRLLFGDNGT